MTTVRLGYDCCRCEGQDCDRKAECLRHVVLADMIDTAPEPSK